MDALLGCPIIERLQTVRGPIGVDDLEQLPALLRRAAVVALAGHDPEVEERQAALMERIKDCDRRLER